MRRRHDASLCISLLSALCCSLTTALSSHHYGKGCRWLLQSACSRCVTLSCCTLPSPLALTALLLTRTLPLKQLIPQPVCPHIIHTRRLNRHQTRGREFAFVQCKSCRGPGLCVFFIITGKSNTKSTVCRTCGRSVSRRHT